MRVKVYMAAYYLAHAVYQSYMSLFYRGRGLGSAQIGAVYALAAAASIPGQMLFGALADRARKPGRVLRALLLTSAALLLLQTLSRDMFALFALAALFGFFYTGVQPIGDALALERLRRENRPFGPARLMGALAFAASALAFGFFLDASGREGLVAAASAALMLVALAASFLLGGEKRAQSDVQPLRLLKNRDLVRLLAFILPAQATMGYFYAFFPTRFMELPGASGTLLGWANFVAAAAEIPFLLASDRLFRRLDAAGVAALSTLALGLRWLLAALAENAYALLASQALHGLGYIAISVSMALYIRREVPSKAQASGQALLNVVCYGLARVLGNALGGLAARAWGQAGGFLACAGLCFAALAAFFPLWRGAFCNSRSNML